MGRHQYRRWGLASAAGAAVVVIGATTWGLGAGTDQASANGTDGQFCTASQVTATMTGGEQAASVHHSFIQVRSRAGEVCRLAGAPAATLQGAPAVNVVENPGGAPVTVTPSSPASVPVSWPDQVGATPQQTPRSITLVLAGSPGLVVPWRGGGVDADPNGHVTVGAVEPGLESAAYPG